MKKISIVSICYNEEGNIRDFYNEIVKVFQKVKDQYTYEIIIADNASTDGTQAVLRSIAQEDPNFKVIFNSRNFGVNRSGTNAFMQASGDAAVLIVSDLQEPPEMILDFLNKWQDGYKVVVGIKNHSEENPIMYFLRSMFYRMMELFSNVKIIPHFTGFGLYDRQVLDIFNRLNDPYPYFRGLIADIGFEPAKVYFTQPVRKKGKSKSNFYYLYEEAMLGITSFSKIPLRLATFLGFISAVGSFLVGMFYLIYKLIFWNSFSVGTAPMTIGLFFIASVQLIFLGVLGEYIGNIYTQVLHRPTVYEKERLNF
jgi:glycosyltransferase involved in cell wall biosynthesis